MTGEPPYARPDDGYPSSSAPPVDPVGESPAPPADHESSVPPTADRPTSTVDRPTLTVDRTRTGGLWVSVIGAAVVLLLLLIFILQNTRQVEVSFFGAHPNLPLGVALLLAAVLGALIVALIGTARIVQLRLLARRHRGADRAANRAADLGASRHRR
jgi:uncharacterized integral membrane protein